MFYAALTGETGGAFGRFSDSLADFKTFSVMGFLPAVPPKNGSRCSWCVAGSTAELQEKSRSKMARNLSNDRLLADTSFWHYYHADRVFEFPFVIFDAAGLM